MDTDTDTIHALDDAVDQVGGELQFLARIPAGGKGRSHKGAPSALLGHHHLGEHRFVELNEIATGIAHPCMKHCR